LDYAKWGSFANIGVENSGGTKIFSVSGHVERPGNYEIPMGMPFKTLLELSGGVWKGRKLKAVIPGGPSTPVLPAAEIMKTTLDYDGLKNSGSSVGAGSLIVMDETTCMVSTLKRDYPTSFMKNHVVNAPLVEKVQAGFIG